jgi:hypothetical protein
VIVVALYYSNLLFMFVPGSLVLLKVASSIQNFVVVFFSLALKYKFSFSREEQKF